MNHASPRSEVNETRKIPVRVDSCAQTNHSSIPEAELEPWGRVQISGAHVSPSSHQWGNGAAPRGSHEKRAPSASALQLELGCLWPLRLACDSPGSYMERGA